MSHTVIGLFDHRNEAQSARTELIREGFMEDNIDLSNKSAGNTGEYNTETVSTGSGSSGGISGFFNSLFGDDSTTANNYTNVANDADTILTVHVDSDERARHAAEILDRNGAIDVDERGTQPTGQNYNRETSDRQNLTGTAQTTGTGGNYASNAETSTSIPIIEEQLQIGKQQVESGGARIRSRVIEKPVEASVRLREEHVVVNRHPVNREVSQADMSNFKEGDFEIREHSEVPVVDKQARVVEEVEVGKTVTEREETVRDTVRRTDVDVDETDTNVTNNSDYNNRSSNR